MDTIFLATLFLTALIHANLQLSLGSLTLLYHYSYGRNSIKKTRALGSAFISGFNLMTFLTLSTVAFFILIFNEGVLGFEPLVIIASLLGLIGIFIFTLYYHKGQTTSLWLPKKLTNLVHRKLKTTKYQSDAFMLGTFAYLLELPLSLPLLFLAAGSIISLPKAFWFGSIFGYIFFVSFPLFLIRLAFKKTTLPEIQKWRVQHKNFFRFYLSLCYFSLALFITVFWILPL